MDKSETMVRKVGGSRFERRNTGLSDIEKDVLRSVGFNVGGSPNAAADARALSGEASLIEMSLCIQEAAALLGATEADIHRRVAERKLFGFFAEERHWLPSFQFAGQQAVRGLDLVLAALDPELHPVEVEAFFVMPDADLVVEKLDHPLSPAEWLKAGRSTDDVVRLAIEC